MIDTSLLIIHLMFFIGAISYAMVLIDINQIKKDMDYLTTLIETLIDKKEDEGEDDNISQ